MLPGATHPRNRQIRAALAPALTGLSAIVGQIVLMREVIATFNGNELSLAGVLAVWLFWTAVGSGLVARFWRGVGVPFALAACLSGLSLAPTILAIRRSRDWLHLLPGELASPALIVIAVFVCLSVFCCLTGCMFVFAARLYQRETQTIEHASSYAYLFETFGSAFGGVLTALLLLRALSPLQIAILILFLNIAVVCVVMLQTFAPLLASIVCLAIAAKMLILGPVPHWERISLARMWGGFALIASHDSNYGRISILGNNNMLTVYQDGIVQANVPDPAAAEETAHIALLEHPSPRKILLIGGGLNGSLAEALKHPSVAQIDYVELDPALVLMAEQLLPLPLIHPFSDSRVHLHTVDARLFLNSTQATFDEIILSTSDPANAQLNRFYTAEFFHTVRRHLAPDGVFALSLHSSEEVISDELGDFLRCIHATMQIEFPFVAAIPGDTLHLFGALQPGIVTDDPHVLVERLLRRHIETQYTREYALLLRMSPDRLMQIRNTLQPRQQTRVNKDAHPVAYYFSAVLWCAQFNSTYTQWLRSLAQIPLSAFIKGLAALVLLSLLLWVAFGRSRLASVSASIAVNGYTLMAVQILLLLSFQAVYGVVYSELAMLIGALMAGIGFGSWIGIAVSRRSNQSVCARYAAINQVATALVAPLLLALVSVIARSFAYADFSTTVRIAFLLLALMSGISGGCQFPLATAVCSSVTGKPKNLGMLYALDLAGGCIGALLLAAFLLPLFGFWSVAWIAAGAGAPAALALAAARLPRNI